MAVDSEEEEEPTEDPEVEPTQVQPDLVAAETDALLRARTLVLGSLEREEHEEPPPASAPAVEPSKAPMTAVKSSPPSNPPDEFSVAYWKAKYAEMEAKLNAAVWGNKATPVSVVAGTMEALTSPKAPTLSTPLASLAKAASVGKTSALTTPSPKALFTPSPSVRAPPQPRVTAPATPSEGSVVGDRTPVSLPRAGSAESVMAMPAKAAPAKAAGAPPEDCGPLNPGEEGLAANLDLSAEDIFL